MALQDTLDNLRERPHHERHTIAMIGASLAVVVLLVAWGFFFFRSFGPMDVSDIQESYDKALQTATPPPDTTGWVSEAPREPREAASKNTGQFQMIEEGGTTSTTTQY